MQIHKLHDGELSQAEFGIRAHRLSQAAAAGLQVPEGYVMADAQAAIDDLEAFRVVITEIVEPGQLYALRASPGRPDWGGPYTLLSLGMNDEIHARLKSNGDPFVANELYRQAIVTYGIAVKNLEAEPFDTLVESFGDFTAMTSIDRSDGLLMATRALYEAETGIAFQQNPVQQIVNAVQAMARGWQAPTARILRMAKGAPVDAHLALILQKMVHGLGSKNGVGRAQFFDAETGQPAISGIFVTNTLTAGGASPKRQWSISDPSAPSLKKFDAAAFEALIKAEDKITNAIGDAPEVKFVIEQGRFYVTEVMLARRTPRASLAILRALVGRGALSEQQALLRIDAGSIAGMLHPQIDPDAPRESIASGIAASPGAATGRAVFSSEAAMAAAAQGESVILVRHETGPEDIRGMHAAKGVLTIRGGNTSHAAVIARGIGLPAVVGAQDLRVNYTEGHIKRGDEIVMREGDIITVDGTHGEVIAGAPKMIESNIGESIDDVLRWANAVRRMGVRVNADTPDDARRALRFGGVEGIGLCRTEHMFFGENRLSAMSRMILSQDDNERDQLLRQLERDQRSDFIELFEIMKGKPVTIRLLDPPLHEFLPNPEDDLTSFSRSVDIPTDTLRRRIRSLYEINPMLGMRGVRLGIVFPEIYEMQARAIFQAAAAVNKEAEKPVVPEIMIPLVSAVREVEVVKASIDRIARGIVEDQATEVPYLLGVMVETPRAALRAGELSKVVQFLSMGTNDLTQMTYGLSRDDAGRFMRKYVQDGVYEEDPFLTLDIDGVGELLVEAARRGRGQNKDLLVGLCGEHGGDPKSIHFCALQNFDYVSCSPFRVPIAQIAAAQAEILLKTNF